MDMLPRIKTTPFLLALGFLVYGCVDSPVDPTLLRRGISGITYTDESGNLIGAVDHQDWLTPLVAMPPAFPNPTSDTIHFRLGSGAPQPGPARTIRVILILVNDEGRELQTHVFQIRNDIQTVFDLSLSDYPDGMYRIRYVASDFTFKHGDIWKTSAADEIRRNLLNP